MTKAIITEIRRKVYGNEYALEKMTKEIIEDEIAGNQVFEKVTYATPHALRLGIQSGQRKAFYYLFPDDYCPV